MVKRVIFLEHVPKEHSGLVLDVLKNAGLKTERCFLFKSHNLPGHDELAGLVIMGGHMDVDEVEKYPWLLPEKKFIEEAIRKKVPTLGVCLGAQLLADVLGAPVYENAKKEIGFYELEVTRAGRSDPLLQSMKEKEYVFEWHRDTFEIPKGCVHLAKTSLCPAQAFRYEKDTWALQFHLEVTEKMIRDWLSEPKQEALWQQLTGEIDPDKIRAEIPKHTPRQRELAGQVFGAFAKRCQSR